MALTLTTEVRRFLSDDDGATAIEYALIAMMVGIVAIAALFYLGGVVSAMFGGIATSISTAGSGS